MATSSPPASVHRLVTYALFAALAVGGLTLEKSFHEMHLSKLLLFAAIGVWAREIERPARYWLLGMVGVLWLLILIPWYTYRHQHLVPLGHGAYRIENSPE
jgi:hypothetical protein